MDEAAIKVSGVSKTFKLPHEKQSSIKSVFLNLFQKKNFETQKALNDISFEVKKGEFFGIVGRNGSGKSTLLKLLAGIYSPTKGNVQINGSLTPFIELGVGFNPNLTGRENVYLNGALLGFNRKEMNSMYDEIVEFAEIGRFMDQKLKNYSSGMQVRLAFSIAIRAKSDILLIDEVLAVGDAAFQQKCMSVFENYKATKKTIVLVTHDMSIVERFCTRAMLIKDSQIVKVGNPQTIAQMYSDANMEDYMRKRRINDADNRQASNVKVEIRDANTGSYKNRFKQGETALVHLSWENENVINGGVAIIKRSGEYIFGPSTFSDKKTLKPGAKELYYFVDLSLAAGEYFIMAGLFGETAKNLIEFIDEGPTIIVEKSRGESEWKGLAYLNHRWSDKNDG